MGTYQSYICVAIGLMMIRFIFMLLQKEAIESILNLIEKLGEKDAREFIRLVQRLSEISSEKSGLGEVTV